MCSKVIRGSVEEDYDERQGRDKGVSGPLTGSTRRSGITGSWNAPGMERLRGLRPSERPIVGLLWATESPSQCGEDSTGSLTCRILTTIVVRRGLSQRWRCNVASNPRDA